MIQKFYFLVLINILSNGDTKSNNFPLHILGKQKKKNHFQCHTLRSYNDYNLSSICGIKFVVLVRFFAEREGIWAVMMISFGKNSWRESTKKKNWNPVIRRSFYLLRLILNGIFYNLNKFFSPSSGLLVNTLVVYDNFFFDFFFNIKN